MGASEDTIGNVLDVLANDTTAPDVGETLSVIAVTQPAGGSVGINGDGSAVIFDPDQNFDGVTTFEYTVSDGNGGTDTAIVTITMIPANDAPAANDDAASIAEDASATVIDVLANDTTAPDTGETLSVIAVTQPANGSVALNAGVVEFTPNADFDGVTTFEYTISDGNGGTDTAIVTVTMIPANDAPAANDDAFSIPEGAAATVLDVLANDSDAPDTGETLSVIEVTQSDDAGIVTLSGGVVEFTPNPGFDGVTMFTYTISDGNGGTDMAIVTITMIPANDPPTASDDAFAVLQNSAATVLDVLANDSTAPDSGETLSVTAVTQPANATVTLVGGVVEFTPNSGFAGATSFTYTIDDGNGGTDTATVNVSVVPPSGLPAAIDDAFAIAEDSAPTVLNVLANDLTSPGNPLSVIAVTQPANGVVTLIAGVVSFTPNANFDGATTFGYTASDELNGRTDTAIVTITMIPVNDLPTANDDAFSIAEDAAPTVFDVLTNDSTAPDVGETLTVIAVTQPANGTATLMGGVVEFTPNANFDGATSFDYTISDGSGGTDTANIAITMIPANDAPSANDDAFSIAEDAAATVVDVLANDTIAPDAGETLSVVAVTQPANGVVALAAGVVSFTPPPDFDGATTFTYTISDGNGGTDTATAAITTLIANDPPAANDDAFTVAWNAPPTTFDVLANDTIAPDSGETLTVTAVTQPANGTVTLVGGVVQFTPDSYFAGTTTFTYTISDGNGGTDTATVTVLVTAAAAVPGIPALEWPALAMLAILLAAAGAFVARYA